MKSPTKNEKNKKTLPSLAAFLSAILLLALPLCMYFPQTKTASAEALPADADKPVYGLIGENVILYDELLAPITGLPATYFVTITGEDETHYQVTYNDLSGLVEKIRIFKIDYEPKLKFGTAFFIAQNDTHPVIIRKEPTSNSVQLSALPDKEKAFYYGKITGEALIPAAGNVWYYLKYDGVYGYVYSAQGTAEAFAVNPGDRVAPPASPTPVPTPTEDGFPDWGYILLLSVPAVIIMLVLFGRAKSPARPAE